MKKYDRAEHTEVMEKYRARLAHAKEVHDRDYAAARTRYFHSRADAFSLHDEAVTVAWSKYVSARSWADSGIFDREQRKLLRGEAFTKYNKLRTIADKACDEAIDVAGDRYLAEQRSVVDAFNAETAAARAEYIVYRATMFAPEV